jgi:hypothetical protein
MSDGAVSIVEIRDVPGPQAPAAEDGRAARVTEAQACY